MYVHTSNLLNLKSQEKTRVSISLMQTIRSTSTEISNDDLRSANEQRCEFKYSARTRARARILRACSNVWPSGRKVTADQLIALSFRSRHDAIQRRKTQTSSARVHIHPTLLSAHT